MTEPDDIRAAHKSSIYHRDEVMRSELCGCFHCGATFSPAEITRWTDQHEPPERHTALCPRCEIDSVLGSASGFPVEGFFLEEMRRFWFSAATETTDDGGGSAV